MSGGERIIRYSVGPAIADARANGLVEGKCPVGHIDQLAAVAVWHELKPTLTTAESFLSDSVIDYVIGHRSLRPPFGLLWQGRPVTSFDGEQPYAHLAAAMSQTLITARQEVFSYLAEHVGKQADVVTTAFAKANEIMMFSKEKAKNPFPEQTNLAASFDAEIVGGSLVMARTLELIQKMHDGSPERSTKIARKTTFHLELADLHGAKYSAVFFRLIKMVDGPNEDYLPFCQTYEFNPDAFFVEDDEIKVRPEIFTEAASSVEAIRQANPDSPYETGCAALRSLKRLWNWHVEIAPTFYE